MEARDPNAPMYDPGEVLADKYRILRLIGRGGMAEVYAAHHEILHRTVAVKMLLPTVASSEAASRFLNEARAAARVRGEHIAGVMDVGTLPDGTAFMVLEYLEGSDLEAHIGEHGPLPIPEAVDHVLEALQALAQAHALGIVHRDLKPSNLFLARQPDGTSIVKVLDFGISKVTRSAGDGHSTATSAILGSPFYMAPEQARSAKSVDARADIWAIGVILYKLLTAVEPLRGESLTDLLLAIVQDEPKPVRELRPEVPEELEAVITRCLRKKPDDRFPDIGELATALAPYGGWDAERAAERINRTLRAPVPANTPLPEILAAAAPKASPVTTKAMPTKVEGQPVKAAASLPGPGTTSSWGNASQPVERARRSSKRVVMAASSIVGIALVAGIGLLSMRHKDREPSAASSSIVSEPSATASPPAVVLAPPRTDPSSMAAVPAPDASPSSAPSASPSASASPALRKPGAAPRPASAPAGSKPPATAAPAASFDFLNQRN